MNRWWNILALATLALLCACSSAQQDWNKASSANTVAAYKDYLARHPSGQNSVEATNRIHALEDDAAWSQAQQANSVEGYRDYLQKEPAGLHITEAQDAVTAAQRAADWKSADSAGTVPALQDFLNRYPKGAESDQARTKIASLTGYRVRLTSASSEKLAQRERAHLSARYGKLLHDVVVVPAGSGKHFALESAPMSQSQADSACNQLKKSHQRCEVVRSEAAKS
ncbi:MAG TPA: SPOR domain-containing protein [Steroidobacteraceae bacterium]|nr:SPOR domain-containing protein [Steroidobacteraceae bacterium]